MQVPADDLSTWSPEALARELRRTQKKLARSQWHRVRLEASKDQSERALRQLIEESRAQQADLEANNEQLTAATRRLIEANRELQHVQASLLESEDRAQLANRVKSTFLANMSHEVRTPLNAVIGYAALLSRSGLDASQQGLVGSLEDAASALLTMFDNLLEFSTLELEGITLRPAPTDPGQAIEQVAGLFSEAIDRAGLDLQLIIDPALPGSMQTDGGRLRQVAINLIGNAVKFTEQGHVRVTLKPWRSGDGKGEVEGLVLEVSDTGPGFSAETTERLFEPFVQGDSSSTRRHGGTGLGLAITRQIVEAMGGTVRASSAPGEGARFVVVLPAPPLAPPPTRPRLSAPVSAWVPSVLRQAALRAALDDVAKLTLVDDPAALIEASKAGDLLVVDLEPAESWSAPVAEALRQARGFVALMPVPNVNRQARPVEHPRLEVVLHPLRPSQIRAALLRTEGSQSQKLPAPATGARVLLCEDNAINQRVGALMLQALDCEATLARTGKDALEAWRAGEYDLILMDCQMPEMDGFEASRQIRAWEAESGAERTPIVALTASARSEDRERCLEAGMDDHVAKPVTPETLASLLRRWA